MVSNLAKLCGCDLDGAIKTDAMDIFKDARDFAIQLRMLKAVYTFRMYKASPNREKLKHGFNFSDESMDDRSPQRSVENPGQALPVDFINCPGLYKRGNNSGANYETQICLIKMGVICNAKELCLNSGPSTLSPFSSKQAQKPPRSGEAKQKNNGNGPIPPATKTKRGSSNLRPVDVTADKTGVHQHINPSSRPTLASGSPAPNSHDAAQMQPNTMASMTTRSQVSPKADSMGHSGKSNKSMTSHHPPMRAARGRGGGNSGKRTKSGKGPGPDDEFDPESGACL